MLYKTWTGQNGRFSQLLRPSRKRRREDLEEETKERYDESLESVKKEKDKAIDNLKEQIAKLENLKKKYLENEDKLHKLFDLGVIDNHDDFIPYKPGTKWNELD